MNALLLLLLDSRSPAGAHNHSGGMEAAVTAGFVDTVDDVDAFCRGRLMTGGRVAASFAAMACQLWDAGSSSLQWWHLDREFSARTPSEAMRSASRQLGSGLRRLVAATVPSADLRSPWSLIERPAPHQPLVLGAGVALGGGTPSLAARAAALGMCTASASAAIRLLGLDPYAVHGVVARLAPEIDALAMEAAAISVASYDNDNWTDLPADGAPALDLLADVHLTAEVRLFAS
jgi:urease accessory protein